MAKTQLNLELNYKGKDLDKIKHGSGLFKKEWFIGSNKHLLWQVLLPSFPDKHKLVTQKGNELYLNLLPGSQLECVKHGQNMDQAALSGQRLLSGNSLLLQNDMEGTLTLHPDWQVKYSFGEPYTYVLTEEEKQIVATYSRRAESTPQEKFGRSMIILFLFITIVFLGIYDLALKPAKVAEGTLEAALRRLRSAQRVEAFKQEVPVGQREDDEAARLAAEAAAKAAAEAAAKAEKTTATTRRPTGATARGASSLFGVGKFDPNAVVRDPIAITSTREFVAASRRGGTGGGGYGTGTGGTGFGGGGGGTGGGMASTFDPNAIVTYQQSDFTAASPVGGLAGTTARPSGRVEVRGNITAAEIATLGKPVAVTSSERAAITRISQRAPAISEGNIASAPQEYQSDMEALRRAVNSRKSQLTSLYRKTAAIQSSGGSVDITIYGTGSRIEAVQVVPTSGNLPNSFLNEIKQAVSSWSVSGVSGPFNYKFSIRFG